MIYDKIYLRIHDNTSINTCLFSTSIERKIQQYESICILAVTCRSNMVYRECGSACPKSCNNMVNVKCQQECVDGCHCPDGMYWDPDPEKCVPEAQCSCYRDGIPYPHGSTRLGKCEEW